MRVTLLSGALALTALAPTCFADPLVVQAFGDHGWRSDDTRDVLGVDLVGINNTNAPKPGATASAAHDAQIAQQIQFVAGPAGSTYGGAVAIDGTSSNSGKSNFSVISSTGFAAAGTLLTNFSATYEWYGQPNPTSRTLAFKLGIQSESWGTGAGESQNGFTAVRSGESVWDLVLVHVPSTSDNAWSTVNLDSDSGVWSLFRQAGNAYFPTPGTAKTLADWAADPTFGAQLFGANAIVSSVQFGLGSSQRQSIGYVDYLQTNLLNGGEVIDFQGAVVPLPPAVLAGLLLFGGVGASRLRRSRRPG